MKYIPIIIPALVLASLIAITFYRPTDAVPLSNRDNSEHVAKPGRSD